MKISILKEKYPKTWNELVAFVQAEKLPTTNLYDFRYYFDSVGIYPTVDMPYKERTFFGYIQNFNNDTNYDTDYMPSRSMAEHDVIIKCFELREKELTK